MSKNWIIILSVIGGIILFVLIIFFQSTSVYDNAIKLQNEVKKSWGDVQSNYQRRADLIPNLVSTVKASADFEKSLLVQVTQARAGIVNAKTPEQMEMAGKKINTAINLAFEAYPQIKTTEAFQGLQVQLEGTENRINISREAYNNAVNNYNAFIQGYWRSMFLSWHSSKTKFEDKQMFESKAGAENAPDVGKQFNENSK